MFGERSNIMHFRPNQKLYPIIIWVLMIIFSVWGYAYCDNAFEIKRVGNIHPYEENAFRINAKEDGFVTIRIHDDVCVYRELAQRISTGETTIQWDGCAYNKEKLYEKTYTITAEFQTDSGQTFKTSFQSPVEYPGQCLQYAMPSSGFLYLDTPDSWFVEYRTVKDGTVMLTLTGELQEEAANSYKLSVKGGKINRKTFGDISKIKKPEPGKYILKIYELSKPEEIYEYLLEVSEKKPEEDSVSVTGEIMPGRDMTEEEIWNMMMQPSVVIDIDFFKHQNVYEKQDTKSPSLGTLHGQTQGVKVISIEGSWAYIGAWNHEEGEYVEGWVPLEKLKTEEPAQEYGLLVDKQNQTMSIYHKGKVIDTLYVSTGRAERNSLYQETAAGCFLTGYHRVNFSTNGKKYDYVIQYDGGNLLHQTPYDWGKNKKDFTLGRAYLGAKASHACIRIQPDPGKGGLNAYWLFTHLPYHTRVIILDDPDERKAANKKLKRDDNSEPEMNVFCSDEKQDYVPNDTVSITFCGTVIPGGSRTFNARKESFVSRISKEGYQATFSDLCSFFAKDDLTCADLGCILEGSAGFSPDMKDVPYGPKDIGEIFRNASIELLTVADDRIYLREDCFTQTITEARQFTDALDRLQPVAISLKGHLIGFAGCSENEYLSDVNIIRDRIALLKEMNCEKIVFFVSRKEDKEQNHSIVQEAMANRCVLAGADFVIFNHNGQARGIDYIRGVPVIYNAGTLMDGSTSRKPKSYYSMLVQVQFDFASEEKQTSVTVVPVFPYGKTGTELNTYCPETVTSQKEIDLFIRHILKDSTDEAMEQTNIRVPDQS